jgi:hypothetical protein
MPLTRDQWAHAGPDKSRHAATGRVSYAERVESCVREEITRNASPKRG